MKSFNRDPMTAPMQDFRKNPDKKKRKKKPKKIKPVKVRCFIGIQFTLATEIDALRKKIAALAELKETDIRLVPDENLHVTLKFVGSVEESQLAAIEGVMKQVAAQHSPLSLQSKGMGFFKNSIWVGIEENAQLSKLAADLNLACVPLGIVQEDKEFLPHVTVARLGKGAKLALTELLQEFSEQRWGELAASKVSLYRSDTLPDGARYTVISEARLGES
ncbi:MAG: RNA 2',3'-cyclic phosphodiesterase [Gammaproteobacteria bacterium]